MRFCVKCWLGASMATAILVALGIAYIDAPLARYFLGGARHLSPLGEALGTTILVSGITLVISPLLLLRLIRGSLSDFYETIIMAGCTALASFTVNDFVLKRIFGRQNVVEFLTAPEGHGFRLFNGDMNASFPSGHCVMAAAGLFVFTRVYPQTRIPVALALAIIAVLLVLGGWHFFSDIVAGLFLGAAAGTLAGDIAASHFEQKRERRL